MRSCRVVSLSGLLEAFAVVLVVVTVVLSAMRFAPVVRMVTERSFSQMVIDWSAHATEVRR